MTVPPTEAFPTGSEQGAQTEETSLVQITLKFDPSHWQCLLTQSQALPPWCCGTSTRIRNAAMAA